MCVREVRVLADPAPVRVILLRRSRRLLQTNPWPSPILVDELNPGSFERRTNQFTGPAAPAQKPVISFQALNRRYGYSRRFRELFLGPR